ncbi:MAG: hypothetical protein O7J95_05945 [Planctomycetota bacterium]|nr:hypothetical protein [Planctomycetota bacterium]
MNRGLIYLLNRQTVGFGRQLRRRFRGVKGILGAIGVAFFLLVFVLPAVMAGFTDESPGSQEPIRRWGPAASLAFIVLTGLSTRAIYFKPAEIDFLFPAPLSRRQLLVFNVLARLRIQLLSGVICFVFVVRHAPRWYAAFTAVIGVLFLLQLTSQCSGLFFSALGEAMGKRLRRIAWIALATLLVGSFFLAKDRLPQDADPLAALRGAVESAPVRAVTWITRPFVELFVADRLGDYVLWAAASLGMLAALFVLVVLFDVGYTESAVHASRKVHERLRRMMSGGGAFVALGRRRSRFSLPQFPWLGGAGPLAWRQCVELSRNLRSVLTLAAIMLLPVLAIGFVQTRRSGDGGDPANDPRTVLLPLVMVLVLSMFLSQNILFDFRRDLDRMGYLKTLPLSARAVAAGQMVAPVCLLSGLQFVALVILAFARANGTLAYVVAALLVVPPFNWISLSLDNIFFLYFPYRVVPRDTGNFPFMGRVMVVMLLKVLILGLVVLLGSLLAAAVWFLSESPIVVGLTLTLYLVAVSVPLTLLIAHAFGKFDLSRDVPA